MRSLFGAGNKSKAYFNALVLTVDASESCATHEGVILLVNGGKGEFFTLVECRLCGIKKGIQIIRMRYKGQWIFP